jgi:hypothetical protein
VQTVVLQQHPRLFLAHHVEEQEHQQVHYQDQSVSLVIHHQVIQKQL